MKNFSPKKENLEHKPSFNEQANIEKEDEVSEKVINVEEIVKISSLPEKKFELAPSFKDQTNIQNEDVSSSISNISILGHTSVDRPKNCIPLKEQNLKMKLADDFNNTYLLEKKCSAIISSLSPESNHVEPSINDTKLLTVSANICSSPVKPTAMLEYIESEKVVKDGTKVLNTKIEDNSSPKTCNNHTLGKSNVASENSYTLSDSTPISDSSCDESKSSSNKYEIVSISLTKKSNFLLKNSSVESLSDVYQVIDDCECTTESENSSSYEVCENDLTVNQSAIELNTTLKDKTESKSLKHETAESIIEVSKTSDVCEHVIESQAVKNDNFNTSICSDHNINLKDKIKSEFLKPESAEYIAEVSKPSVINECVTEVQATKNGVLSSLATGHDTALNGNMKIETSKSESVENIHEIHKTSDSNEYVVEHQNVHNELSSHICKLNTSVNDAIENNIRKSDNTKCIKISKYADETKNVVIDNSSYKPAATLNDDSVKLSKISDAFCSATNDKINQGNVTINNSVKSKPDELCTNSIIEVSQKSTAELCDEQKESLEVNSACSAEISLELGKLKENISSDKVSDDVQKLSVAEKLCIVRINEISQKDNVSNVSDNDLYGINPAERLSPQNMSICSKNIDVVPQKLCEKPLDKGLLPYKVSKCANLIDSEVCLDITNVSNDSQTCKNINSNKDSSIETLVSTLNSKTENKKPDCCKHIGDSLYQGNNSSEKGNKVTNPDNFPYICESKSYLTFSDISVNNKEESIEKFGLKSPNQMQNFAFAATTEIFSSYRNDPLGEDMGNMAHSLKDDVSSYCPELSDDDKLQNLSSDESDSERSEAACQITSAVADPDEINSVPEEGNSDKLQTSSNEEKKDLVEEGSCTVSKSEDTHIEKSSPIETSTQKTRYSVRRKITENITDDPLTIIPPEDERKEWDLPETVITEKSTSKSEERGSACSDTENIDAVKDVSNMPKSSVGALNKNPVRQSLARKSRSKEGSICGSPRRYSLRQKSKQSTDDSSKLGIDISQLYLDSPSSRKNIKENTDRSDTLVAKLLSIESSLDESDDKDNLTSKRETRSTALKTSKEEPIPSTPGYNLRVRKSIITPAKLKI